MDLRFITFNSILYGNLMPWLAENQDREKFRFLLRKIAQAECGASNSFFTSLLCATKDLGLNSGQKLTDEWKSYAIVHVQPDASDFIAPFNHLQDEHPKLVFYTKLIAQSITALFSLISLHLAEKQSQSLQMHRTMNYMKSLSDMIIMARDINPTTGIDCAIIDRLLAGLTMLYAETGNRFSEYIEPNMLRVTHADMKNILIATHYRDENTLFLFTSLAGKYFPIPNANHVTPSSLPKGEEHPISLPSFSDPSLVPTSDAELLREVVKMQEDLAGLMKDVSGVLNKKETRPKPEVKLIGSAEVCKILHISKSTLKAHREQKLYSFTKIGSRYLYSSIEINKILELNKHK